MSTVVTADGVAKWWSAESGLRPVSFAISAGELVVVRGRSGSGKSTLLSLLAGWADPDEGTLSWCTELGVRPSPWNGVAFVPQVLALVPELTVQENIELSLARPHRGRVDDLLDQLDLGDLRDRFPDETSLGQQQRVAVARAAVASPTLFLADEPTCHQDPHHVEAILRVLGAAAAGGSAVLVATHEAAVVAVATHVVDLSA